MPPVQHVVDPVPHSSAPAASNSDDRTGAVNQLTPQIGVAALGDAKGPLFPTVLSDFSPR